MSTDEDHLVFESFLRKRKKRMKLKWVPYWFRLQNSMLCFYSQKPGSSLQLKGQYYIWMVQSVREVEKAEGKHYAFEISMKNGKKKLLAADTADLRQTWLDILWSAMQSPGHRHPDPACIWQEGAEPRPSGRGSLRGSLSVDEMRESDSGRLRAASEPWSGTTLTPDPRCPATPPTAAQNPASTAAAFDSGFWRSSLGPPDKEEEAAKEDEYDILPCRTPERLRQEEELLRREEERLRQEEERLRQEEDRLRQEEEGLREEEEGIYDVPLSNMRATEDPHPAAAFDSSLWRSSLGPPDKQEEAAVEDEYDILPCRTRHIEIEESIYDVPSSLLRRLSEHSIGTQLDGAWLSDGGGVPQGDEPGFQSGMVGWMTPAAEG